MIQARDGFAVFKSLARESGVRSHVVLVRSRGICSHRRKKRILFVINHKAETDDTWYASPTSGSPWGASGMATGKNAAFTVKTARWN